MEFRFSGYRFFNDGIGLGRGLCAHPGVAHAVAAFRNAPAYMGAAFKSWKNLANALRMIDE